MRKVRDSSAELRIALSAVPADIFMGQAGAAPVSLVPTDADLTAAGLSSGREALMDMPDFTSLGAFSYVLGISAPMLEHDMVERVAAWSQRAGTRFGVAPWYNMQSSFRSRLVKWKGVIRMCSKRILALVALSSAGALRVRVEALRDAAFVPRSAFAAMQPLGALPINPFVHFTDDLAAEGAWAEDEEAAVEEEEVAADEEEEEEEDDEGDDDGDEEGGAGGGGGGGGGGDGSLPRGGKRARM
jgi:hypothetical protein